MSTDEYSGTRWRHIFSHVSGASVAKKGNGECTMSNPAIQNNANDIKNSIVNIWNILYVFKYLSNFIPHLDQIYIYIFLSYFLSRHFFFIGSHTRFLEIKYYFSLILTRGKNSFQIIYPLQFQKKKKNKETE